MQTPWAGYGYFFEGRLDMMDATNEWFQDNSTKVLYLKMAPGDSPSNHTMQGTVNQFAVSVASNVNNIVIRNLHLEKSQISLINCRNVFFSPS